MASKKAKSCFVCGSAAFQNCGACHVTAYCGRDHQRLHWRNGHKAECGKFSERAGHLVAARDLEPGTEILREEPILITPLSNSTCLCSVCYKVLNPDDEQSWMKCSKCEWPLCSEKCESSSHHAQECNLLQNLRPDSQNRYAKLAALRFLMIGGESRKKFENLNLRKGNLVPIKVSETNLGHSESEINQALNTVTANSCEINKSGYKYQGFYVKTLKVAHNCIPNSKLMFVNDNLLLMSTVKINKGELITCSYVKTMIGTLERKEQLLNKGIDCSCKRCADPTELGTFAGSVYCFTCAENEEEKSEENVVLPKMLSSNPLDILAPWTCEVCNRSIPSKFMKFGNITIHEEIDRLDKSSPAAIEKFLSKYEKILHPTNAHVIRVKFDLMQIYGTVSGYSYSELDIKTIDNIVNTCQDLLEIAEKLDPGWSKFRGCLLMSLQAAMVIQTKHMFNNNLISKNETTDTLGECMVLLQEAVKILSTEPELKDKLTENLQAFSTEMDFE